MESLEEGGDWRGGLLWPRRPGLAHDFADDWWRAYRGGANRDGRKGMKEGFKVERQEHLELEEWAGGRSPGWGRKALDVRRMGLGTQEGGTQLCSGSIS